jgi:hypothetical protein
VSGSSTPDSGSSASRTRAIAGGVTGVTTIIVLGLIILCILRRKHRYRAARLTSAQVSTFGVPGPRMLQSARLPTIFRPFLDLSVMPNHSPSKEIPTDNARRLLTRNNQKDIEKAENPFRDPRPTERNLSNNDNEGWRVRGAPDCQPVLTSQLERELKQLCTLARSGQLSTEDRLKLEEIGRTTGLTILFNSRHDQPSAGRSASSGSSLVPPSYHTHGS